MKILFQGISSLHHYNVVLPAYIQKLNPDINIDIFVLNLPEIPRAANFGLKRFRISSDALASMVLISSLLSERTCSVFGYIGKYIFKPSAYHAVHLNEPFVKSTKLLMSIFTNVPKLLTFHDHNIVNYNEKRITTLSSVMQKVNAIVVPSTWLKKVLYEKTGINSIVIPHCIDLVLFNQSFQKKTARNVLKIDTDKKVVIWNGRLDPDKDPKTMIKVVEMLSKEDQEIFFLLHYRVNYPHINYVREVLKSLKNLEKNLRNKIRIISKNLALHNMPILYRAADVYFTTSPLESFSLATAEAMACGLPVVVPRSSAIPEVVGDAGLYCKVGDAECFANKILKVLEDEKLAKNMSLKGLRRVSRLFSPLKVASLYSNLYKSILT